MWGWAETKLCVIFKNRIVFSNSNQLIYKCLLTQTMLCFALLCFAFHSTEKKARPIYHQFYLKILASGSATSTIHANNSFALITVAFLTAVNALRRSTRVMEGISMHSTNGPKTNSQDTHFEQSKNHTKSNREFWDSVNLRVIKKKNKPLFITTVHSSHPFHCWNA